MDTNETGKSFSCSRCGTTFHFHCEGGCQVCQMCFNSRALCSECLAGRAGITLGPPESPMWLVNEAEDVRVEWCNLGEGCSGDFDETDPSDVNLLRFDIHVRIHRNGEWEDPGDASYCTLMPANAPEELLEAGLRHIMKAVESSIHNLQSIKKTCEELSWISPEWFKDKAVLSEAVGNAYEVLVTRTSFAARHITVRARSVSDATMKALDQAGDYLYSEHDAEYEADAVREIVSEPEVA